MGLSSDANQDAIKKAYRKLAMKYHPDKVDAENKDEAEGKFKKITEAYTILSDEEKKNQYDMFGTTDGGGPGGGMNPMGGMNMGDLFKNMFRGDHNPFGGMFGFGGGRPQQGQDVCQVEIPLQEIYHGTTKKIDYEVSCQCQTCKGLGATDPNDIIKCITCGGKGVIVQQMGPMILQTQCPSCFGNCTTIKTNRACSNCKGAKFANYKKSIKIEVPKGIPDKFEFKLSGKGNYNPEVKSNNDLLVVFNHMIPANCSPIGSDGSVTVTVDLKLDELFCGFVKTVNIYGQDIKLVGQGYFNPSKITTFSNSGFPVYKKEASRGDLHIKFNMVYDNDTRIHKYLDVFLTIYKRTPVTPQDLEHALVIK